MEKELVSKISDQNYHELKNELRLIRRDIANIRHMQLATDETVLGIHMSVNHLEGKLNRFEEGD